LTRNSAIAEGPRVSGKLMGVMYVKYLQFDDVHLKRTVLDIRLQKYTVTLKPGLGVIQGHWK